MKKYILRAALTIAVPFSAALVLADFFVFRNNLKENVLVEIPRGAAAARVGYLLEAAGAVRSAAVFRRMARLSGSAPRLKAGVYEIRPRESVFSVAARVAGGDSHKIRLTVPEGYEAARIAVLAEAAGFGTAREFADYASKNKLEGYLFPETYFFEHGTSVRDVADRMKQEFDRRVTPEIIDRAARMGLDPRRLVILASIIEKEATKDDRRLVSAVFHNRLRKRMYLESCATVLYALGGHKEKITYADLKVKSPYNTYINYGLPPGPICNPGMDSILAAVEPADSDALFFVVDGESSTHIFSRYYKEHLGVQRPGARRSESRR